MTQQVVKAQVFFADSQTLADIPSLTLYVEATGSNPNLDFSTAVTPQTAVMDFLNNTFLGAVNAPCYYLHPDLSRTANASTIKWTDVTAHLDGSPAGAPFRTDSFTLGAAGGALTGLPLHTAAVVGYRRPYGSDLEIGPLATLPTPDEAVDLGAPATHSGRTRPRSRDRGRFFLGPLGTVAADTHGEPSAGFKSDLADALHNLFLPWNNGASNQFNFVQWSRRNSSVGQVSYFYINEGFGVQERRGDTTANRVHSWVSV